MTTLAQEAPVSVARPRAGLTSTFADAFAVARRHLIAYRRIPQLLVFSTIQPVIFVLMFRYVFGNSIKLPGNVPYADWLMPGIFVQTVTFGSVGSAIGIATDMKSGLLERFRSLPMARSAVLLGRTFADLMRNMFVMALMTGVGVAIGFRPHRGWIAFLIAVPFVLAFGYALSWIFATVGLILGDPETAQAAAFPLMAPLVFASSAFVSVDRMPGWLQAFAAHQPVSLTASAVRAIAVTTVAGSPSHYAWQAIAWYVGILLVFIPYAVRRYRTAV